MHRQSINAIRAEDQIAAKDIEKISSAVWADEVVCAIGKRKSLFHGLSAKPQTLKALKALKTNLAYACGLVEW
jgi:hypothetical protein